MQLQMKSNKESFRGSPTNKIIKLQIVSIYPSPTPPPTPPSIITHSPEKRYSVNRDNFMLICINSSREKYWIFLPPPIVRVFLLGCTVNVCK